jgi:hypothetical protein
MAARSYKRSHRRNAFVRNRSKPHHHRHRNPFVRNRRRTHHYRHNAFVRNRRRHYRRNPDAGMSVLGLQLPPIDAVLFVGAGFITPPIVSGMLMGFVPDGYKTNSAVIWVVKGASVLLPSMLVRQFISRRAGNLMLIGGAVSFGLDLLRTFAPGVIPGLGYQPLLGAFVGPVQRLPVVGPPRAALAPMISSAPTRLSPDTRF